GPAEESRRAYRGDQGQQKGHLRYCQPDGVEEQARVRKEAEEAQKKAYEDTFKNPLKPAIDANTRIRGAINAMYTLVQYADFQCPYCAAGYQTVVELRKKHGDDMRFIFKHLPLPFHPQAMPAAQW